MASASQIKLSTCSSYPTRLEGFIL